MSLLANANAATATAGLSVLAPDPNHQRGTFPNADLVIAAAPGAQQKGVQRIRLGGGGIDAPLFGFDRTASPAIAQTLVGNFGVLYRVELALPVTARAGITPRGGAWGGYAHDGADGVSLPSGTTTLASTSSAIVLGPLGSTTKHRSMTAGGSNLPIDLFLVTP